MNYRIAADSACDLLKLEGADFVPVPLKICTDRVEYVDDAALDVGRMTEELRRHKGRSFTSCPNVTEWEEAYGDAENVFVFTVTGGLSGSYSAAVTAAKACMEQSPSRRIHVFDSRSAGPEMQLQIEALQSLLESGADFGTACEALTEYQKSTHLLFALESLHNFAQNGRCSKLAAAAAGILGIRAVGKASEEGTLELLGKRRGAEKAADFFLPEMEKLGYHGGKVVIGHCDGEAFAGAIRERIRAKYPTADVEARPLRGLCSYYAEAGGILMGFAP